MEWRGQGWRSHPEGTGVPELARNGPPLTPQRAGARRNSQPSPWRLWKLGYVAVAGVRDHVARP